MKKLYEGNIRKNFFVFALPLVMAAILSQAYHIINTIMAGWLLGDNAISAIGSTSQFISLVSSLFWGYGSGSSIYVAMLFGSGNYKKMVNVIKINLLMSSLAAILISALCIAFYGQIFDFLNIEPEIRQDTFLYFATYMAGLVFIQFTQNFLYISNAVGLAGLPFFASLITNVLNISGNYIFVRFFGLGVGGTALATVLSALCVGIFYLTVLIRKFKANGVKIKGLYISKDELKFSIKFAFPTTLQQSVMYLCGALVSPLTNLCGAGAIAGYTVGMRLYDLNAGVYQNSNKTVTNYIAQCIGADKVSLITKGIKTGLCQTILFLLPFLLVTVFGADMLSGVFLDSSESLHYSVVFMRYCMPFVIFNVINNLLHAVFRSSGAGKYLVVSTVIYSVSRFGFSYLLFEPYGMYGIYAAIVLSWITEAIFGSVIYFSGRWKKSING